MANNDILRIKLAVLGSDLIRTHLTRRGKWHAQESGRASSFCVGAWNVLVWIVFSAACLNRRKWYIFQRLVSFCFVHHTVPSPTDTSQCWSVLVITNAPLIAGNPIRMSRPYHLGMSRQNELCPPKHRNLVDNLLARAMLKLMVSSGYLGLFIFESCAKPSAFPYTLTLCNINGAINEFVKVFSPNASRRGKKWADLTWFS